MAQAGLELCVAEDELEFVIFLSPFLGVDFGITGVYQHAQFI